MCHMACCMAVVWHVACCMAYCVPHDMLHGMIFSIWHVVCHVACCMLHGMLLVM